MTRFTNKDLDLDVEIVSPLTQRQAVPYWEAMSKANGVTGPAQWHTILESAVEGKWFVEKIKPLDYTPAQARWLAEELATHLLEQSQVGEV